eukprot:2100228-Amphidinium_carterae.1
MQERRCQTPSLLQLLHARSIGSTSGRQRALLCIAYSFVCQDVFKGPNTVCIALTRCYSDLSSLVDSRRSPLRDETDIFRFTRHLLKAWQ